MQVSTVVVAEDSHRRERVLETTGFIVVGEARDGEERLSVGGNRARPRGVDTVVGPLIGAAMRRLVLVAVLLVPLAAAPSALGKEVMAVTACGSDGCSTSKSGGLLKAMTDVGPPTDAPARPAGFYRLDITVGDGDEIAGHDRLSWVPAAGVLLTRDGTWISVRPEVRSGLERLTRGLEALPAGRLDGFPAAPALPPQAPAGVSRSAGSGAPIWILVSAVAALVIGGVIRGHRIASRRSGALQSAD